MSSSSLLIRVIHLLLSCCHLLLGSAASPRHVQEPPNVLIEDITHPMGKYSPASSVARTISNQPLPYNILNLHFHKSGGTTVCKMFKKKIDPPHTPVGNCNCINFCPSTGVTSSTSTSTSTSTGTLHSPTTTLQPWQQLDELFNKANTQFCAIERGDCWPKPHVFHQLAKEFHGIFMTVLRDPWARYYSNFQRDYARCEASVKGSGKNCSLTIQNWATLGDVGHLIDNIGTYKATLTSRPNFFVRMLNGLANPQSIQEKEMNQGHLTAAKRVLMTFSSVSLLEQDAQQRQERLDNILKLKGLKFGGKYTNNVYSGLHAAHDFARLPPAIEEARSYKPIFEHLNRVDYELYNWVQNYFNISLAKTS